MKYKIDVVRIRENRITVNGWTVGKTETSVPAYSVTDSTGRKVEIAYVPTRRDDVSMIYFKKTLDRDLGFDISFDYIRGETYTLAIGCDGQVRKIRFNEELIAKRSSIAFKRREKIKDLANMETVRVAWEFFKKNGLKALYSK